MKTKKPKILLPFILGGLAFVLIALVIVQGMSKDTSAQVTTELHLLNNATDCGNINGTWTSTPDTCTLTANVTGSVRIDVDNLTLDGANNTIIADGNTLGLDIGGFNNSIIQSDNVTIKNLTISGGAGYSIYADGSNLWIESVTIDPHSGTGIFYQQTFAEEGNELEIWNEVTEVYDLIDDIGATIIDTVMDGPDGYSGTGGHAILINEGKNILIDNFTFNGQYRPGVYNPNMGGIEIRIRTGTSNPGVANDPDANVTIKNSHIYGNSLIGNYYTGVKLQTGGLFENNIVEGFYYGAGLYGHHHDVNGNRVVGEYNPIVDHQIESNEDLNCGGFRYTYETRCEGKGNTFYKEPYGWTGLGEPEGYIIIEGADTDGDGIEDIFDNCPADANLSQEDTDGNGVGDACNDADDPDGDEWSNTLDNCPDIANPDQADLDKDGIGTVCDPEELNPRKIYSFTSTVTSIEYTNSAGTCDAITNPCDMLGYVETLPEDTAPLLGSSFINDLIVDVLDPGYYIYEGVSYDNPADDVYFLVEGDPYLTPHPDADKLYDVNYEINYGYDQGGTIMMATNSYPGTILLELYGPAGIKTAPWDPDVVTGITAFEEFKYTNAGGEVERVRISLNVELNSVTPVSTGTDTDGDGINDDADNCPTVYNPLQADYDGDGEGNVCDTLSIDGLNAILDDAGDLSVLNADDETILEVAAEDVSAFISGVTLIEEGEFSNGEVFSLKIAIPQPTIHPKTAKIKKPTVGPYSVCIDDSISETIPTTVDKLTTCEAKGHTLILCDGIETVDGYTCTVLDAYLEVSGFYNSLLWTFTDIDLDDVNDPLDNCPNVANPGQQDTDGDGPGDFCDVDDDNDMIWDKVDTDHFGFSDDFDTSIFLGITYGTVTDRGLEGTIFSVDTGVESGANTTVEINVTNVGPITVNYCGGLTQTIGVADGVVEIFCVDTDGDGIDDGLDNCPAIANPDQANQDGDEFGDVCDDDIDGDSIENEVDPLPTEFSSDYYYEEGTTRYFGTVISSTGDFIVGYDGGNVGLDILTPGASVTASICGADEEVLYAGNVLPDCLDSDQDGLVEGVDSDPENSSEDFSNGYAHGLIVNPVPADSVFFAYSKDSAPDRVYLKLLSGSDVTYQTCSEGIDYTLTPVGVEVELSCPDTDGDGHIDTLDNCPADYNQGQEDLDGDGIGDVCDTDVDGDGIANDIDLFPYSPGAVCSYDPATATLTSDINYPGEVIIEGVSDVICDHVVVGSVGSTVALTHTDLVDAQRLKGVVAEGEMTLVGGINGDEIVQCIASKNKNKNTCDLTVSDPITGEASTVIITTEASVDNPPAEYSIVCNPAGKNCKNVPVLTASLIALLPPQAELNVMANLAITDGGTVEAVTDPTEIYANMFTNTSPTEMLGAEYLYSDGIRLGDGTVPAGTEMALSFPEGGESVVIAYVDGVTEPTLFLEAPVTGAYVAEPLYKNHGQQMKYTKSNASVEIERLDANGELVVNVIAEDGTHIATVITTGGEDFIVGHEGTDSVDVTNTGTEPVEVTNTVTGTTTTVDPGETTTEAPVLDQDEDGIADDVDNCPLVSNADQADLDFDGIGDVCDADIDGDGTANETDCDAYNPAVAIELVGYVDADGDGVAESNTPASFCAAELGTGYTAIDPGTAVDNCPLVSNADQADHDFDGIGDVCDADIDGDGTANDADCDAYNPAVAIELVGYVDADGDGVAESNTPASFCAAELGTGYTANDPGNYVDNCPHIANSDQSDIDGDGIGDACDIAGDSDGDGVLDDVDYCPDTYGRTDYQGCPIADLNTVTLHTVNIGGGASTKAPLAGAEVRVFDRDDAEFQLVAGSKNPNGSEYGMIFEADAGKIGSCTTDSTGECLAGEENIGDMLVIVKYVDSETGQSVYVGRPKSADDFVDTDNDGTPDLATKDFQIIKVFKKGVFQGYRGGSKMVISGSFLEVILPESAIWEGTSSVYPFIFTSDSNWTVDVCAEVPGGYEIIGVYDENGDLVTSTECIQTFVSGETKVAAFEVLEVGSPEPDFAFTMDIDDPHGKKYNKKFKVNDVRKDTFKSKVNSAKAKVDKKDKTLLIPLAFLEKFHMQEEA